MAKLLELDDIPAGASDIERTRRTRSIDLVSVLAADDLKSLLAKLADLPGVSLAMLVDRQGFLIESAGDAGLAPEMAGALATCLAESSDAVGRELGHGGLHTLVLECDTGTILVNAAGPAAILAAMLCDRGALAAVRHDVKQMLPQLVDCL